MLKKKKTSSLLLRNFQFPSYAFVSDGKCTRAENLDRLKQNRSSFDGYLENACWYVGLPPGHGTTSEQVRLRPTCCLSVKDTNSELWRERIDPPLLVILTVIAAFTHIGNVSLKAIAPL